MVGHFLFLNYFKHGHKCGFDVSTKTFRKSLKLASINIKQNKRKHFVLNLKDTQIKNSIYESFKLSQFVIFSCRDHVSA